MKCPSSWKHNTIPEALEQLRFQYSQRPNFLKIFLRHVIKAMDNQFFPKVSQNQNIKSSHCWLKKISIKNLLYIIKVENSNQ